MTKMINPAVMRAPLQSAQILGAANPAANAAPAPRPQSATVMPQQMAVTQAPAQQIPQTGLIGAEQALLGGHSGAVGALSTAGNYATGAIQNLLGSLGNSQQQPLPSLPNMPQVRPTIMPGAPQIPTVQAPLQAPPASYGAMPTFSAARAPSVGGGIDTSSIAQGLDQARGQINTAYDAADQALSGYNKGQGALDLQASLSGANGPEAQAAAYAQYNSSPAMQYQMDQMQKATERSAAARGGLLGGNVLTELQRNASGIASQDYQNQFNNLGQVAQTGLAAAGQIAQTKQQQAATEAGLASNLAGIQGNLAQADLSGRYNLAGQQMSGQNALAAAAMQGEYGLRAQQLGAQADLARTDLSGRYGLAGQQYAAQADLARTDLSGQYGLAGQQYGAQADLIRQQMQNQAGMQQAELGVKANLTAQLADIATSAGINMAGLYTGTGQQLAQGRTQAGQAIAQNANQAASSISNMLAQNGVAVSDMMAKDISTVTDMIYQSGMQEKIDSQQLAAILANISGGQASTVAQGYSNIGAANAAGTLGMNSALQSGTQQLIASGALGGGK